MIKLITILSEIKNVGGKHIQELIFYVKKYNDIIDKLNDIKDTYKNHGQGYASKFNQFGDSSSSSARIDRFPIPVKTNIQGKMFAYKYAKFEPFAKWASNPGIVQNLIGDTKEDITELKNRIKLAIKDYYFDRRNNNEKNIDRSILDLKKLYQNDLGGEEIHSENMDVTQDQELAWADANSESTLDEYDVLAGGENNDDEYYANKDFWGGGLDEIQNISAVTDDMLKNIAKELFKQHKAGSHSVRYYIWLKINKDIRKKYKIRTQIYNRYISELPPQGKLELYKKMKDLVENPPKDADEPATAGDPRIEEIKNLPKIDINKVQDLIINKVGLTHSTLIMKKYIKKEGLDNIYERFPMSVARRLSPENLHQLYLELVKVWDKIKPVDEVYTDDLGGEEIYGS